MKCLGRWRATNKKYKFPSEPHSEMGTDLSVFYDKTSAESCCNNPKTMVHFAKIYFCSDFVLEDEPGSILLIIR